MTLSRQSHSHPAQVQTIALDKIRLDGGTQPRAKLDDILISEYTEAMQNGAIFPPVAIFYDSQDYWLADGFHRLNAAQKAGLREIAAEVYSGTQLDAQWHSYSVNQSHGLRRSNEDKQRAVRAALLHTYGARCSDSEIARHCAVSVSTVWKHRKELELSSQIEKVQTRTVTRKGTTYTMNTTAIGPRGGQTALATAKLPTVQPAADSPKEGQPEQDSDGRSDLPTLPRTVALKAIQETGRPDVSRRLIVPAKEGAYTPSEIMEAVSQCLGSRVDFGSDANAQIAPVPSTFCLTRENRLVLGRLANSTCDQPPDSQVELWLSKLISQYETGATREAIVLVKADTSTFWFRRIWQVAAAVCFLSQPLNITHESGEQESLVLSSAVAYLGSRVDRFYKTFWRLGSIVKVIELDLSAG